MSTLRKSQKNGLNTPLVSVELFLTAAAMTYIGFQAVNRASQGTTPAGRLTTGEVMAHGVKGRPVVDPNNPSLEALYGPTGAYLTMDGGRSWVLVPVAEQATEVGATIVKTVSIAPETDLGQGQSAIFAVGYSNPGNTEAVVAAFQAKPDGNIDLLASAAGDMDLNNAQGVWTREPRGGLAFTGHIISSELI